jgi:fibronectin-binding autotransporter adhesin
MSRQARHAWILSIAGAQRCANRKRLGAVLPHARRLAFEPLEDRRMLSITVTTTADTVDFNDGVTSLREAIFAANTVPGADTIEFAPALTASGPAKILLTQGELKITDSLSITGPGADLLTIDASGNDLTPGVADGKGSGIFNIDDGSSTSILTTQISGLTLTGADTTLFGGAILSRESLSLANCTITGNASSSGAGGVAVDNRFGDLTVTGCTFTKNFGRFAALSASATVSASNTHALITDSTFTNNTTGGNGTIVSANNATLSHVTVANNSTPNTNIVAVTLTGTSSVDDCQITTNQNMGGILAQSLVFGVTSTFAAHNSVISGNGWIGVHVLASGMSLSVDIEHCTVSNNLGSGVYISGGRTVTIAESQITGNLLSAFPSSGDPGGGIIVRPAGTVSITDCLVAGNTSFGYTRADGGAGAGAGGISLSSITTAATISGCAISDNQTMKRPYAAMPGAAGGIAVVTRAKPGAVPILITNCQVTGNSASSGAGILVSGAGGTISGCSITYNHATADGGGIAATTPSSPTSSPAVTVQNCMLDSNSATRGGGIFGDSVSILGCTFSYNSAEVRNPMDSSLSASGGGIYANTLTVINCTFFYNQTSGNGGGIFTNGAATILSTTFTQNSAQVGGAAFIAAGKLTVRNTLLAANFASIGPNLTGFLGSSIDAHFSLIGNGTGSGLAEAPVGSPDANGNLIGGPVHGTIDPQLGPLAYNGGPTFLDGSKVLTRLPLPGSPAIDAGDPAAVAGVGTTPAVDERGDPFNRVVEGRIDMGAAETGDKVFIVDTLSDDSDGDHSAGQLSLREAIELANISPTPDTIRFAPSLVENGAATITLRHSTLNITAPLTIIGLGPNQLTIDASGADFSPTEKDGGGITIFDIDDHVLANLFNVNISDLSLTGGDSADNGGAIYSEENLTLSRVTITNNSARRSGGGICSEYGELRLLDCTISSNGARDGGGIATLASNPITTATITNCTISGNTATSVGGGIWSWRANLVLAHSTITGNEVNSSTGAADTGGGILINAGYLGYATTIADTIIAGNRESSGNASDVSVTAAMQSPPTIRSTLVGYTPYIPESPVGSPDPNGNLVGGPVHGAIDPMLGPLAFNGGPTKTHALLPGSPAIDAGDPTAFAGVGDTPAFDERGALFSRVFGGRIDMGALESQPNPLLGDYNFNGIVDTADYTVWRDALGSQVVPGSGADGSGNGFVDQVDYEIWQATFGNVLAPVTATSIESFQQIGSSNPQSAIPGSTELVGVNPQSPLLALHSPSDSPPSPIIVTTLADTVDFGDGLTSLREAIFAANTVPGANTIEFAPSLTASGPAKTLLTQGELKITESLTITGPGADLLTIDASGNDTTPGVVDGKGSRIFNIDNGSNTNIFAAQLSDLALTGADATIIAGAILSRENLTLANCTITGNACLPGAGGVYNKFGELTVTSCTFTGNSGQVAAISNNTGTLLVADSILTNNTTRSGNIIRAGNATLSHVTLSNNFNSSNYSGNNVSAVFLTGSNASISDCEISTNQRLGGIIANGTLIFTPNPTDSKITIQNSTISGNGGIGIFAVSSSGTPTIDVESCTVSDNLGAGISIARGTTVTITDCYITGNTYGKNPFFGNPGGGIKVSSAATVTITNCLVAENTGVGAGYGAAGSGSAAGINLGRITSMATISGCTITGNKTSRPDVGESGGVGGGIAVLTGIGPSAPPISITNCQITGNAASSGAGIFVSGAGVTISECSIAGNQATADGGGIATSISSSPSYRSAVSVQNCTITGNTAARGGGIAGDMVTLLGCTVGNNSAVADDSQYSSRNGNGGGIYANTLSATNCTISGNSASANGGGVFIATGTLTGINTLLAANIASSLGPDISGYLGTTLNLHYSLVGNASGSGLAEAPLDSPDVNGNLIGGPVYGVIDPQLSPLADNGGFTVLDGSHILTMALLPGSPAINGGDPTAVAGQNGVPQFDQRGAPFTRVSGGRIDIGAVESQPNPLPGDYNFDGIVDAADYTVWADTKCSTTDLRADGDASGVVDAADYAFWIANFGTTLPEMGSAASRPAAGAVSAAPLTSSSSFAATAALAPPSPNPQSETRNPKSTSSPLRLSATARDTVLLNWLAADSRDDRRANEVIQPRHTRTHDDGTSAEASESALDQAFDLLAVNP